MVSNASQRQVRRDAVALPSNTSAVEIIIRLDPKKAQPVRQVLSVRSGDGRLAENGNGEVSRMTSVNESLFAGEDNDPEVVEEGRFSCRYFNSKQSVRDAKLGHLVVSSDHVSFFDSSSSRSIMSCFVYEVSFRAV